MPPLIEVDLPVLPWLGAAAGGVAAPCTSCAAVVPASDGVAVDGLASGDGNVVGVPVPCVPGGPLVKTLLLLLLWLLATPVLSAGVLLLPRRLSLVGPELLLPTWFLQETLMVGLSQDYILPSWIGGCLVPLLWLGLPRGRRVPWLGLAGSVRPLLLQGCCYQLLHLCFGEDGCSCCLLIGCCCFLVEWAHSLITLCHGLGIPCRVRCGGCWCICLSRCSRWRL